MTMVLEEPGAVPAAIDKGTQRHHSENLHHLRAR
jgi:hypothetical protein